MSDIMRPLPFESLLRWILRELEVADSVFGIHRSLFFSPKPQPAYATADLFGHYLTTPIGPAAGPHTQLAQNIAAAWLSGGRFIELKTVQIMDCLKIPRPCIDMEDEGYNVEWSQELNLDQSAWEYIKAWVLVHILRRLLGFDARVPFGTIFNMSVGYNLEGIKSAPMVRFMDRLEDASGEIAEIRAVLHRRFPEFADIDVPSRITDSVTLSTMHGCPPDEIEAISRYLLLDRGLHTYVKLNPTLLGQDEVMSILHEHLGYHEISIPARVFEHDLQYGRAVCMIRTLKQVAADAGRVFGIKLSNTLAMANHKRRLPGDEMYMSGRALYPITMSLFQTLSQEFEGDLNVSYSAGADALNVATILAAGAQTVTAASDLLKPGGYSRLLQWLENLELEMRRRGVSSLRELARDGLTNVEAAAEDGRRNPRYKRSYFAFGLPKSDSGLGLFDCIAAPCVEQCAVCQDVPEYAWLINHGEYDQALQTILHRNPLPGVTGYVCTHLCETRCTRNNYEQPVAIRDLKRFASEHGNVTMPVPTMTDRQVAVIGSGPSGLAAAYFLALNGIRTTIFEARSEPGGMLAIAPHFRLPRAVVRADIERITNLGVQINLNSRIALPPHNLLSQGFDAVYIACGLQKDAVIAIEGIDGQGVFAALRFLEQVAQGQAPDLGSRVLVIGGGNTAMDAARTAHRLTGQPTTVVYRRTQEEMPAEPEELRDFLDEGNRLIELASPTRVLLEDDRVIALQCIHNVLGKPGPDGRRQPRPMQGTEFEIGADSIIFAVGQQPDVSFLNGSGLRRTSDGRIVTDHNSSRVIPARPGEEVPGVYAGGDLTRGPAIIIEACADGRKAAEAICLQFGLEFRPLPPHIPDLSQGEFIEIKGARTRREHRQLAALLPLDARAGFHVVEQTLTEEAARAEAGRCLQCSSICDKCVEVCPNRANYAYQISPLSRSLPILGCHNGSLTVVGWEPLDIIQARQIVHVQDFCNECGNCTTFCVHSGAPYRDKPRLFLQMEDFRRENDNAFYIDGSTIWRRDAAVEGRLRVKDGVATFENGAVRLTLSPEFEVLEAELVHPFDSLLSVRQAAEMALLLEGIGSSTPCLLS